MTEELSIEIDCAPMTPRPETYFEGVIKDTGLTSDDFHPPAKWFGNWKWILKNEDKQEVYRNAKPTMKTRLENLYNSGAVRYASW